MDEWELLQRFAQHGSQEAFAELVSRHLNFVYSSARRQVRSPELAQDVAQNVFLELARQAGRLKPGTPLTSWLYLVTRRAALNTLRTELRRQAREHAAYELSTMNPAPSVWEKLAPSLDEALETLNPDDRSALLLRFFENKPLREVGAALGASEDAAQKRVSRALENLRRFFARQGIAVSAAGLATHLSAHAVEAAPATLGSLISTAASSLAATSPALALEATRTLAMTTLQKSLFAAVLVVTGAGVYEVRVLAGQRDSLVAMERDLASLSAREAAARQERDVAQGRLAAFKTQAGVVQTAGVALAPTPGDPAIAELVARAERLKNSFETNPALKIPEMALLKDSDWLDVARERSIGFDAELRASLARIRSLAKSKLASQLVQALSAYVKANEGRLPFTAGDLQPYMTEPIEPVPASTISARYGTKLAVKPEDQFSKVPAKATLDAMLARYAIKPQGSILDVPDQTILILESEQALIDRDYDSQLRISRSVSASDTDPFKINSIVVWLPGPMAATPPPYLH